MAARRSSLARVAGALRLACLCASGPMLSSAAAPGELPAHAAIEAGVESPRLRQLLEAPEPERDAALAKFWDEVRERGAPLVEPLEGKPRERLVTFLYRSTPDVRVVLLTDFGDTVPRMTLARLGATDVWQRSFALPDDARFLYEVSVDDPEWPFVDRTPPASPSVVGHDELNPKRYEGARPRLLSLVELPAAPPLLPAEPGAPRGRVAKLSASFRSEVLGNQRPIWSYLPAVPPERAVRLPLLVFPASYLGQIRLPAILDDAIAAGRIRPTAAAFYDWPPGAQDAESGGDAPFCDFLAKELLPFLRETLPLSDDPRDVILGGASAGGHLAVCAALRHPEAFGGVLAQSGAFWRGIGGTAADWGDPSRDGEREGAARLAAGLGPVPVHFVLTIGTLECGAAFSADAVSMLHASRHLRDVLQAKGCRVDLLELHCGHDPYGWETALPAALAAALGPPR